MYNYSERYDEVDLEKLPQRERRETMIIQDPEKGLRNGSKRNLVCPLM